MGRLLLEGQGVVDISDWGIRVRLASHGMLMKMCSILLFLCSLVSKLLIYMYCRQKAFFWFWRHVDVAPTLTRLHGWRYCFETLFGAVVVFSVVSWYSCCCCMSFLCTRNHARFEET
jgi:hypothetical protein